MGLIMDGNLRFQSQDRGNGIMNDAGRFTGHLAGYKALKRVVKGCVERRIEALTVYAMSSENWVRSSEEVSFLLNLFETAIKQEHDEMVLNDVRVKFIGSRLRIPSTLIREIKKIESATQENKGMHLTISIDYSARNDIANAARLLALMVKDGQIEAEEINEAMLADQLSTSHLPPLDLIIRTSGEQRLSNFMLWEAAYAELVWVEDHWPAFSDKHLDRVLEEFATRSRKFGLRPTH